MIYNSSILVNEGFLKNLILAKLTVLESFERIKVKNAHRPGVFIFLEFIFTKSTNNAEIIRNDSK